MARETKGQRPVQGMQADSQAQTAYFFYTALPLSSSDPRENTQEHGTSQLCLLTNILEFGLSEWLTEKVAKFSHPRSGGRDAGSKEGLDGRKRYKSTFSSIFLVLPFASHLMLKSGNDSNIRMHFSEF